MNHCCPQLGTTLAGFIKPKREVNTVFIHCTATSNPAFDAVQCDHYHRSLGWSCIGYHFLIKTDGTVQHGRDLERVPSAQAGYNTGSIAISLNGLEVSDFTEAQYRSLRMLCANINVVYGGRMRFRGHCEVAAKACPVFDYRYVLGLDRAGQMTGVIDGQPPIQSTVPLKPITVDMAQLGIGDTHPQVRLLQAILALSGPCHIDGVFGADTEARVREFQEGEGLMSDGICGPATWERLLDAGSD